MTTSESHFWLLIQQITFATTTATIIITTTTNSQRKRETSTHYYHGVCNFLLFAFLGPVKFVTHDFDHLVEDFLGDVDVEKCET